MRIFSHSCIKQTKQSAVTEYVQKFLEVDITADDELLYIINITNVTDDQMFFKVLLYQKNKTCNQINHQGQILM